jgi:hypothetical protein
METRQRPPAPGAAQEEKRGANVEVYGFVAWIATGLTFGTTHLIQASLQIPSHPS